MKKTILFNLILLFAAAIPASAVTLLVPDEYPTIQEAIESCENGDIVIVSPGTYKENIDFLGKNITVTSTDPEDWDIVGVTIIDGNDSGSVVTFENDESNEAVLTGFTITGGVGTPYSSSDSSFRGAGIFCYYSSPTISCNIITNNHGPIDIEGRIYADSSGGGIYSYYSDSILTRNIIKNNSAFDGGGIYSYRGQTLITNNFIHDNQGISGGGVSIYNGSLINNTIINNNSEMELSSG